MPCAPADKRPWRRDLMSVRTSYAECRSCPKAVHSTEALTAMGKRLGLRLIAEGVEQVRQLEFLGANGCDAFQVYLFAKPLTVPEISSLLKSQQANR